MAPTLDRARLERRRELLQLRLKRQDWSRTFRDVAPLLCGARIRFAKLPPASIPRLIPHIAQAPGRDERIHWPEVANARCCTWSTPQECSSMVVQAVDACGASGHSIAVIFHPATAGLLLNGASIGTAWPLIHDHVDEAAWVVAAAPAAWAIEISRQDRDVCFSKSLKRIPTSA